MDEWVTVLVVSIASLCCAVWTGTAAMPCYARDIKAMSDTTTTMVVLMMT